MTQPPATEGESSAASEASDESFGVRTGDVIAAKYEIVKPLGAGGMGAVFQARHQTIGKLVAIKILRADLASDRNQTARFLQEARAANEVTHRNIVEVLDFGSHEGRPYLVMEFLRGESLAALLERERRLSPAAMIRLVAPVLRALTVAHQRGVIHRDIKPDNIFLARDDETEEPTPKILDFGIAKRVVGDDVRLTDTRAAFGTPAYMAPEQAMGARDVTPAADQYAIGVMLYEGLTGRLPHEGNSYNGVIVAKVTTPPTDLTVVAPELDPALAKVVMRALSRDPAERFSSVSALREALEPFAGITTLPPASSLPPRVPTANTPGFEPTVPDARSDPAAIAQTAGSWNKPAGPSVHPPRMRPWMLLAGLAVVPIVGVAVMRTRHSQPSSSVATNASVAPRAVASVTFHLQLTPAETEIRLDGVVVGHGSVDAERPRDGARHALHASAPGYEDLDDVITADADTRIERALRALPAPVAPPVAPPPPESPHSTPAAHPRPVPAGHPAPSDPRRPHMDRDIRL